MRHRITNRFEHLCQKHIRKCSYRTFEGKLVLKNNFLDLPLIHHINMTINTQKPGGGSLVSFDCK